MFQQEYRLQDRPPHTTPDSDDVPVPDGDQDDLGQAPVKEPNPDDRGDNKQ